MCLAFFYWSSLLTLLCVKVVGSGGGGGVSGTEVAVVDLAEQRRRMLAKKCVARARIHPSLPSLPLSLRSEGEAPPPESDERKDVIDSECGVALGGQPGGGDGESWVRSCTGLAVTYPTLLRRQWRRELLGQRRRRRIQHRVSTYSEREPSASGRRRWRRRYFVNSPHTHLTQPTLRG